MTARKRHTKNAGVENAGPENEGVTVYKIMKQMLLRVNLARREINNQ